MEPSCPHGRHTKAKEQREPDIPRTVLYTGQQLLPFYNSYFEVKALPNKIMLDAELPVTSTVGSRNPSLDKDPAAWHGCTCLTLSHHGGEFSSMLSYYVGNPQPTFCKYSN